MKVLGVVLGVVVMSLGLISFTRFSDDEQILSHTVDLYRQDLRFFWKDDNGEVLQNYQQLETFLKTDSKELVFAMNGGMFKKDLAPLGLYIENEKTLSPINKRIKGYGNFYLQPNGVFYITNDKKGVVCKTENFKNVNIKYATQSGPMLLIEGQIHSAFRKGSSNLNIRNGVGILPDGKLLFAMSKEKTNFYDFASYFKTKGCKNALYLDGFVSRTYLPSKGYTTKESKFGVMIGEVK